LFLYPQNFFLRIFFYSYVEFTESLYQDKEYVYGNTVRTNGWDKIFTLYSKLYDHRLMKIADTENLSDEIDDVIEDISDKRFKGLSEYEKELLTAILYGSLAYLESSDPSFAMFRNIKKSLNLFTALSKKYKTVDSEFGSALSQIALVLYFEDSFWVNSVLGNKGNIQKGLRKLDEISQNGIVSKVEASLFLIEYYADILHDHSSSVRYTKGLYDRYPDSKYFRYLYARDLYHTGKIRQALEHFRSVNTNISDKFYPFEYISIIYEAKCLYILNENEAAKEVAKYASDIHDGFILENFRKQWMNSVNIRQEVIFRAQYSGETDLNLSEDELNRTAHILFDHCYFRELNRLLDKSGSKEFEMKILNLKTKIIMGEWIKAKNFLDGLVSDHKKDLKNYNDRKRFELLKNIVFSYTE
jgi:hypothetical protein